MLLVTVGEGMAYQNDTPAPPQAAEQNPEQLQQLVAPIALYPDALIAQILAAASHPEEVVEAGQWMQSHKDLTGQPLASAVDTQTWDASVKALTQFPAVLANMNQNLAWTSELGDAYVNQQASVDQAIQTMREKAKNAGNLNTNPQQKVETKGKTIVIEPTSPEVVYVPQYDPWLVYGDSLAMFPGWYPYPGLYLTGPGIGYGLEFGVGFFGGFGWGWGHWGFDWRHGGRVMYNHNSYISHSTTIVNRNSFRGGRPGFNRGAGFHAGTVGHSGVAGGHSSAFSGFGHGGISRSYSARGVGSFGGFHGGGGGFHGGGGHGGGGGRR
jgi:uncharacterized membrane protein YgcG